MEFSVRQSRVEDAAAIAAVQVETWKTAYVGIVPAAYLASLDPGPRTKYWKEQLIAGTTVILVAEDASGVFGFANGGNLRDAIEEYDAELYAIYLLQQKQRRGAGQALVRNLAGRLRAEGFRSLIVWSLEKNPSLGFYTRLGGTRAAEKEIEIGGARLTEIALGWANLDDLL